MSKRYRVRVMIKGEFKGYLIHRDKTSWCKRSAVKQANDCVYLHGWQCIIEEV